MINDSHACIYQSRRIHNNPFIQSLFHSWTTTTTRKQQPQWQLTRYRTNRSAKHVAADELSHFAALARDESEYWIHFVIDTMPYADKSNEANLPSHMRESMCVYSMNHFHFSFDCQRACIDCSFVLFLFSRCVHFFREWKTHTVFLPTVPTKRTRNSISLHFYIWKCLCAVRYTYVADDVGK